MSEILICEFSIAQGYVFNLYKKEQFIGTENRDYYRIFMEIVDKDQHKIPETIYEVQVFENFIEKKAHEGYEVIILFFNTINRLCIATLKNDILEFHLLEKLKKKNIKPILN